MGRCHGCGACGVAACPRGKRRVRAQHQGNTWANGDRATRLRRCGLSPWERDWSARGFRVTPGRVGTELRAGVAVCPQSSFFARPGLAPPCASASSAGPGGSRGAACLSTPGRVCRASRLTRAAQRTRRVTRRATHRARLSLAYFSLARQRKVRPARPGQGRREGVPEGSQGKRTCPLWVDCKTMGKSGIVLASGPDARSRQTALTGQARRRPVGP